NERQIESAHDCSEGGLAVAMAEACFIAQRQNGATAYVGAEVVLSSQGVITEAVLFGEDAGRVVISCDPKKTSDIKQVAVRWGVRADRIGRTIPEKLVVKIDNEIVVSATVAELQQGWDSSLVRALHPETAEHLVPEILQKS